MSDGRAWRRMRLRFAVQVLCLTSFLALPAPAQSVTRVYAVQNRSAEDLLPLVETALGDEGRAVVDRSTNSLVLLGTEQAVADAISVLEQQDRRLRSVVLRYESRSLGDLQSAGIDVTWSAGSSSVRIGNVVYPEGRSGAAIRREALSRQRARDFAGTLRVTEGERGRIVTGSTVPVNTRSLDLGWGVPVVTDYTEWVSADSGFDASVRILGNGQVRVELAPFDAAVDSLGSVRSNEASTVVVLEPGRTVVVGGSVLAGGSRSIDLPTGARDERSRQERVLLLSAEVE